MKDKTGGSLSGAEKLVLREVEKILTGAATDVIQAQFRALDRKVRYERLKSLLKCHWKAWVAMTMLIAAVALVAVVVLSNVGRQNTVAAKSASREPVSPSFPVSWNDQQAVPQARLGKSGKEAGADTVTAFNDTYVSNPINLVVGPSVTVPRNQQVVVVARQNGQPGATSPATNAQGQLTETCLLQTGGAVKQIGVENHARELVSYTPPVAHAAVGSQWCTSDDLFYERMQ